MLRVTTYDDFLKIALYTRLKLMTMQLTEREAMTIVKARKVGKIQRLTRYAFLAVLVALFMLATDGLIDVYDFRAITLVLAVKILLEPFSQLPSYQDLVSLLEKKVSESGRAIEALAEAKSGSI